MPGYLTLIDDESRIIFADVSYMNSLNQGIIRNLTDCDDAELSGISVFSNDQYVDTWPAEDELLSDKLIDAISVQLEKDPSDQFQHVIQRSIRDENGKLDSYFSLNQCPFTSIYINKTRELGVTIIPNDSFFLENQIMDEADDSLMEQYISSYYQNALDVYQIIPNHSLYFSLIYHCDWALSVSEKVDHSDASNSHTYLQTMEGVKNNLINPYLELIQKLHSNQKFHGDPSPSNVTLSKKFNKLIFIDFKYVGESVHDKDSLKWFAQKLGDFHDMAHSILSHLPSKDYDHNAAIIYLRMLEEILPSYCGSDEIDDDEKQVIDENKELTIETIINYVNLFWSIPSEQLVDFPHNKFYSDDLSDEDVEQVLKAYDQACKDNNDALMLFYETLFVKCRLVVGQIDLEDFVSFSTNGLFTHKTDETDSDNPDDTRLIKRPRFY